MHIDLRARIGRDAKKSAALRRINPTKMSVLELHVGAALFGGRTATREEIEAIPLEEIERAVSTALADFPTWALPDKTTALPRASAEERLDAANAELARKAKKSTAPTSPASKRERLSRLPADVRLSIANGSTLFGFNENNN